MSPVATTDTATVLSNGGAPSNGHGINRNSMGGGRGGKKPYPHIDDLTHVTADVDENTPIEKVLTAAEGSMRSAETFKDFKRPDLALQEYMRSFTIAAEVVPRHKDYITFQRDRKQLGDRYTALIKKINAHHSAFERIKQEIQADNEKTGVQPTRSRPGSSGPPSGRASTASSVSDRRDHVRQQSVNGTSGVGGAEEGSESSRRPGPGPKPAVRPKPQALHGNAIKTGASSAGKDALEARFASLRAARPSISQDPLVRTLPVGLSKPMGPRDMPVANKPVVSLDGPLPGMPKVPDAIYSPARGTVSSEAAELPSSTPRGMFSRTNSTTSFTNNATNHVKSPPNNDYYVPYQNSGSSLNQKRQRPIISSGDTITVDELVKLQRAGSTSVKILLIDVRSRADFDDGHIMSQSTICIEPEILQRENPSGNDIMDAIVLSPADEQRMFEKRHDFDLIVFYDQDSTAINRTRNSVSQDAVLSNLYNALTYYDDVDRESDNRNPKLLQGGLEAWSNVMGSHSLQTSTTLPANMERPQKSSLSRTPRVQTKRALKPIQDPAEARRWTESLAVDAYLRSHEEFLRRYPPASAIQESMTSPVHEQPVTPRLLPSQQYEPLPQPPTRPAPALPRPSYSGLSDADNRDQHVISKQTRVSSGTKRTKNLVGLHNPGAWCYANSSIQAMFGSTGFAEELLSGEWTRTYQVPKKTDEKIMPPQLLTKIVANLFHWMQNGKFKAMQAKTLMDYIAHISSRDARGNRRENRHVLGGHEQQDAQEFLSFITAELHDETNIHRDQPDNIKQPALNGQSILEGAMEYWNDYIKANSSLITKYWRGLDATITSCKSCRHNTTRYEAFDLIPLAIQRQNPTVEGSLQAFTHAEDMADYKCDKCGHKGSSIRQQRFARLPDLLCLQIRRFGSGPGDIKDHTEVEFPLRDLDMSPYFLRDKPGNVDDHHFKGSFIYDAYAVVVHSGGLRSGHYWAYVRDEFASDPTQWHQFNDERVTPYNVRTQDDMRRLYKDGTGTAYIVFYQRRKPVR